MGGGGLRCERRNRGLQRAKANFSLNQIGVLGGLIGGTTSSRVLQVLDPTISKGVRAGIVKRSTLGFLAGTLIGGVPMGIGLAFALVTPFATLSYHWTVFVALALP